MQSETLAALNGPPDKNKNEPGDIDFDIGVDVEVEVSNIGILCGCT